MIHRSRFADVDVPDIALHDFVLGAAKAHGSRPAFVDALTKRTITYEQLADMTERVAATLAKRGFRKGDVFAIYSPNVPEYAPTFFGVSRAGGTVTTVNPTYTADELQKQLVDSGARLLMTVAPLLEKAQEAAKGTKVEEIFVLGDAAGATPFAALLAVAGPAPVVPIDPANDVVAMPYSSGTTGLPKGVMLTHRNLVANMVQCEFIDRSEPGDTTIAVLPFFHIYGMLVVMMTTLRHAATVVTLARFELTDFLRAIQDYKVRSAYLVPPIVLALTKHPAVDQFDLSSLRQITSGAAPLGVDLEKACAARMKCLVKQGYGMTETSPVTHLIPEDEALLRPGSAGLLAPSTLCRVIDSTGADVGAGERGELLIKGPQIMKGYLNNPVATAATLDAGGWLHTGDVGYADSDGYFYVVDRLKEFIKYKGYQVAPAELEAVLLTHPAVADAAVIPCADEEAGEVPKAFVVKRGEIDADTLLAHVASRVAPFKKIRLLEFVDTIPKSPSGKILRRVLIEQERARKVPA
jgi:acyl-CoA synthetase (AMP-forming)/AMP-acid ligase II